MPANDEVPAPLASADATPVEAERPAPTEGEIPIPLEAQAEGETAAPPEVQAEGETAAAYEAGAQPKPRRARPPGAGNPSHPSPTPRAPATLVFVPGIGHDPATNAAIVAKSIAAEVAPHVGSVEAKLDTPAAPKGMRAVATIFVEGQRMLDVVELDYRDALETLDAADDSQRQSVPPGLFRVTTYAFRGAWLWLRAIRRFSKGRMAKAQLLFGLLLVMVLGAAAALTLLAAINAIATQADINMRTGWFDQVPQSLVGFSALVSATAYLTMRTKVLRGGQRVRQLLRYIDQPTDAVQVSRTITASLDALLDEGYEGKIHLLGYSFGSIVILDELLPSSGTPVHFTSRVWDRIDSLVTVGCPHDLVALYFPKYFTGRRIRRESLPWRNVFIATDVLGSNFVPHDDTVAKDGAAGPLGMSVNCFRYFPNEQLTWFGLLTQAGFRRHTVYWDRNGGCWGFALDLWGLASVTTKRPS